MSIHDGHRKRLRDRYLREGLDNFEEVNVLELLLFYCMPRVDTNPLAHNLLARFKTFNAVLEASPMELMEVPGVGQNVAAFLTLIKESWRYYGVKANEKIKSVDMVNKVETINQCGAYMLPYFINRNVETVFLLCLDAKGKIIGCPMIGEGSVNSASISVRKIVEIAINSNATSVVLAHNHPSGVAIPSIDDIQTTKRLGKALSAVEIILVDHLVFGDGDFVSIAQSGAYSYRDSNEL